MNFPISEMAAEYSSDELQNLIQNLKGDPLKNSGKAVIPASGDCSSGVFIFGEAPSVNDTKVGENFRGPHSEMFNSELLPMIGLTRQNIYLTNLVKCNPPDYRAPNPQEIKAWSPVLLAEIVYFKPKLVVAMGRFAMEFFLPKAKISEVRAKIFDIPLYSDYTQTVLFLLHPGFAYRNPELVNTIRHDFLQIKLFMSGQIKSQPVPEQYLGDNTSKFEPDSEALF